MNNHYKEATKKLDSASIWFIVVITFYTIPAFISPFSDNFPPVWDVFVAIVVSSLFFFIHIKYLKFDAVAPIFIGLSFLPHILGLYKMIPHKGYLIMLYGLPQLNYHYDWLVHIFAVLFFSIAFCSMTYPYFIKGFKSKWFMFIIILFFMLGAGSLNEIIEYVGYDFLGYGEGFLAFGDGDISPDSGPWQNSSMDMFSNLVGGLIGVGIFLLIKYFKEKK